MGTGASVSEGNEITNTTMNQKLETVVNADVEGGAAIDFSKLATLTEAYILVGSAGTAVTAVAVGGDITIIADGTVAIAAGVIIDADVKSDAAIAFSKLAGLTAAQILVGSAGGVAVDVAVSGDISLDNAGGMTIGSGAVDISKVETALTKDTLGSFLVSFESGELPSIIKLYFNHKVTINKIRSIVVKGIAATDDATITAANSVGDMTNGVITIAASSSMNTEDVASPSSNNVIAADSYIQLTTAKSTAGGKVLVTVEYTRTA